MCVRGSPQKKFQGFPHLLRGVQERGGLSGLVAQVGARWVGAECQTIFEGFPPRIVYVQGGLKFFARGPTLCCEACERWGLWSGWWPGWDLAWSVQVDKWLSRT